MALKSRKEMDPAYQWDFTHIFPSKDEWEREVTSLAESVATLEALKGTLTESEESLGTGLDKIFDFSRRMERVYLYALLHKESDNGEAEYQDMAGRAMNLYVSFSGTVSFMGPEILSAGEAKLKEFIECESLSVYRQTLSDILRSAEHTLDEKGEMMLAMLSDAAGTPQETFGMLESVDMTFPEVKGEDGEMAPLTHGNYIVYLSSADPEVRREAYEKYFNEFNKYINTFAAMYAGSVKFDTYFADVRGYESACEGALFASNVPVSVYDSLISAVHDGLEDMERYIALRRRALKLDELGMYDLYCPIISGVETRYTFEEACDLVKRACEPLGEEYAALLDKAFSEKWIDVYENRG